MRYKLKAEFINTYKIIKLTDQTFVYVEFVSFKVIYNKLQIKH